jgi:hypothetical protein
MPEQIMATWIETKMVSLHWVLGYSYYYLVWATLLAHLRGEFAVTTESVLRAGSLVLSAVLLESSMLRWLVDLYQTIDRIVSTMKRYREKDVMTHLIWLGWATLLAGLWGALLVTAEAVLGW